jgi:lipopolysaccharide transport system permease protein
MSGASTRAQGPTVVIEATRGWAALKLRELWVYRDLFLLLAWRDVRVRYKQTGLGILWTILQPLVTMVVFTVIFGGFAKVPSDGVPYPIFAYAALLPWALFAGALNRAANSMLSNAHLFTKVYFPRLLIPLGSVLPHLVDFGVSFVVLVGLMLWFRIGPGLAVLLLPLFLLYAVLAALALGIWLSALNVRYRDIQFVVPFMVQIGLFVSPIVYPASLIPSGPLRVLLFLNPMTLVIQGFRWGLLRDTAPSALMYISIPLFAIILATGLFYFRRVERSFVDVV